MPRYKRIAITGASAGLGAALARHYAGPGVMLCLCARDITRFAHLEKELTEKGAELDVASVDIGDADAAQNWIARLEAIAPLDLMILNAGQFDGRRTVDVQESATSAASLIATNLGGAAACGHAAAAAMRARRQGHLVFISSLAALLPLADAPAYSASKAGLSAFARALREDLKDDGVCVTLVHPGHIQTDQTARHRGPLPGMVSAQQAARVIAHAITIRRGELAFPARFTWLLRGISLLPWRWQARLLAPQRFTVSGAEDALK